MKQAAIVTLLWPRYRKVIEAFCANEPGITVITAEQYYDPELVEALRAQGTEVIKLESLLDDAARQRIHDAVNGNLVKLNQYFGCTGWEDICGTLELDESRIQPLIKARTHAELPGMVQLIEALNLANEVFDIRLMAVSEDVTAACKTAVLYAKGKSIPSLQLMHGVALSKPYTVHGALFADTLAVYGQRGLESYLDLGIDPQRCHITGNPAWDHYADVNPNLRQAARQRLAKQHGLDAKKVWLVFATTWAADLTALGDHYAFENTVQSFLAAQRDLRAAGIDAEFIIKDRVASRTNPRGDVQKIAEALGIAADSYIYTDTATEDWVRAADVLIGADSNIQVEALLVGTPVINLMNWFGMRLGPSFDADSGVVEVTPGDLAGVLAHLVNSPETRTHLGQKGQAAGPRYNAGQDGMAFARVSQLLRRLMRPAQQHQHIWQTLLDVEHIDSTGYHDGRRPDLVEMFNNEPRLFLDIGCAAGGTGLAFKQKYPEAKVWGIELNASAAAKAATRLDKVLNGKFEDFDLIAEGIEPGTLDAVIIADVLEHMYNPWDVLTRLRPLLSPRGQIVTSIPNTRNAGLMEDLARGYWRYDSWGLLDITHIRFFTYKEIKRFFHETGYRIVKSVNGIDPRLKNLYDLFAPKVPCDIDCGKMVLKSVTLEELGELCSLQFYTMVEVGAEAMDDYMPTANTTVQPSEVYRSFLNSHLLTRNELAQYESRIAVWGSTPLVQVLIVANPETIDLLPITIGSLAKQLYFNVRLTVLAPTEAPAVFELNQRMGWHKIESDIGISINQVLTGSEADWVAIMQAGDELAPHGLLYMLEAAHTHADWKVVYPDEDVRTAGGVYEAPFFKPDFCPDYFMALPYVGDFFLTQRAVLAAFTGFATGSVAVSNFDLLLQVEEQFGGTAIGHVADVLYHRYETRSLESTTTGESFVAGSTVLSDALRRRNVAATVETGRLPGTYRVRYQHAAQPRVSIVVLTREHLADLQRCVEGLFSQTDWPDFELLLLDNGSEDHATLAYLTQLDQLGDDRVRVYRIVGEMNFSKLRNQAASVATGEFLLFLDNDVSPLHADWLSEMMSEAQRPEIGIVGARLLKPDGTVDEAGRVLGVRGGAESPFFGQRFDDAGYFGRLQTVQNYSAVSGSCLLIRRTLFQQIGGFDEMFDIYHADNDLCLRSIDAGGRVLWTPYANLMHAGAASLNDPALVDTEQLQNRGEENRVQLYTHWLPKLAADPAYNQNLSLLGGSFQLESRALLTKRALPWRPLPRLLSLPADQWGCGNYRVMQPHNAAVNAGLVEGWIAGDHYFMTELARIEPDTIVLQRQMMEHQVQYLREYKRQGNVRMVFESDDLFLAVPKKSIHRPDVPRDMEARMKNALQYCDRFLVTTEPLKQAFKGMHDDIRIVPNSIDMAMWGSLKPKRRMSQKPRVGWAGSVSHGGDLEVIYDVVKALADEVEWVFFGMCPDPIKPYIHDQRTGVPFADYATHLAAMNLDLAIAPLELNAFNECKSNLRILEYGILGYPMIATDIVPYQGDYPITLVKNSTEEWVKAIREHVSDLDECARRGDALRQYVLDNWLLEQHLSEWTSAWFEF